MSSFRWRGWGAVPGKPVASLPVICYIVLNKSTTRPFRGRHILAGSTLLFTLRAMYPLAAACTFLAIWSLKSLMVGSGVKAGGCGETPEGVYERSDERVKVES